MRLQARGFGNGCLAKWHHIERGRDLTPGEQSHVVAVIERWLRNEIETQ
jgi:exodeoxyribonuclease V alpha subunit